MPLRHVLIVVWGRRLYSDQVTWWPENLLDRLSVRNEKKERKQGLPLGGSNDNRVTASLAPRPLTLHHRSLSGSQQASTPPKRNQVFPFHVQASSEVRFITLIRSCPFLLRRVYFRTRSCEAEHISFGVPYSMLAWFCNVVSWPWAFMFWEKRPLVNG